MGAHLGNGHQHILCLAEGPSVYIRLRVPAALALQLGGNDTQINGIDLPVTSGRVPYLQ
jgi:hypothetical protein